MENLIKAIKKHEGFSSHVYTDSVGKQTIGYGRNVDMRGGPGISEIEANYLLSNDIARIDLALDNYIWYSDLDEIRKGVIIELAYNVGIGGLFTFVKMIEALKQKDWTKARIELLDSKWRTQVQIARSHDMSYRLQFGQYQDD